MRVAALAGDDQTAWDLTEQAGDRVRSWQLLLVTTDPLSERARSALDAGVDIALKAGLPGPLLQRLVTALDALGEEVPIPLWDLAAKTPQPDDGYLPPTGSAQHVEGGGGRRRDRPHHSARRRGVRA